MKPVSERPICAKCIREYERARYTSSRDQRPCVRCGRLTTGRQQYEVQRSWPWDVTKKKNTP
jgi:hypothetical protein